VQHPILKVAQAVEQPKPMVATVEQPVLVPTIAQGPPAELINLLNSKEWPHAVDPSLICDITSEQDKEDRAEGILDLIIDVHLENLKFLDFGCGEGHVVNKSRTQKPRMAVGYDIKKSDKWDNWEKSPNVMFTDSWVDVKQSGPYNIVLMYDVIDHMICSEEEVVAQLKEIKQALAINGKVYLRSHPWCSRHGTHLYHKLNKAFAHIVFTGEELKVMGYQQEQVRKVLYPLKEYKRMFSAAGFKVSYGPHQIKEGVEPFFSKNLTIAQKIKDHFKEIKNDFPSFQLEQQFIDFVLM
jgi:2-polyprenyl-3-methyl-5-hydroxy-6-metoxy-1,4-benzoquinol methylase